MRVSLSWLEDYVALDVSVENLVERLDLTGTKVEAIHRPATSVSGVVAARVVAVEQHPNADNLILVDVVREDGRQQRVVCGARNFGAGDIVPLATVGARLGEVDISERRIRGEASQGMLCSAAELGISEDHSGILVLPPDIAPGADVVAALGLDDTIVELELTPNRPDCMSMIGVAREVAAVLGRDLQVPVDELVRSPEVPQRAAVEIEDERGCPRYLALELENVRIAPSPSWLSARLIAAGLRPIANVVDVTNYVLLETGQPLHAFDAARVAELTIVVRRARAKERLVTLDGVERTMHPDDLLIADRTRPLAIAGVIGGEGSEISADTSAVLLESAYFDPASVAFTCRRQLLRTEASARFERGIDPNGAGYAARRAARLISELTGARPASAETDVYPTPIAPLSLRLRPSRVEALLGVGIASSDQAHHLRSLGLAADVSEDEIAVEVPTFRPDLRREVDLIEEVGRLAGYERLPSTVPSGPHGGLDAGQAAERRLRTILAGMGLHEAWTGSFGSPAELGALGLLAGDPARAMVELENPTSATEPAMRTSLLPGLLHSGARNLARHVSGAALFEIARVYVPAGEQLPDERLTLGCVFCGLRREQTWREPEVPWDFFSAKGILDASLLSLGLAPTAYSAVSEMPWHPTRAAAVTLDGRRLGSLGELHPDVCAAFEVPAGTVALELVLQGVFDSLPERPQAEDPARYPAVYLDLALVVDEDTPAGALEEVIAEVGAPELASLRLFDVYAGAQTGAGRKSLAFALELRSPHGTLTDEEALRVRDRILDQLRERTAAELRS